MSSGIRHQASGIRHQASGQRHGKLAMNRKQGFTFFEMSMVLVIIGLVVGGIVVAQFLIDTSKMRNDMSTTETIAVAANTFKLKFGHLPGDLPNAQRFGFNSNSSGDGNGQIQGTTSYSSLYGSNDGTKPAEWFRMFYHLDEAQLYDFGGSFDTAGGASPLSAGLFYPKQQTVVSGAGHDASAGNMPGIILSYESNNRVNGHFFRLGAMPLSGNTYLLSFQAGFRPAQAKLFDAKFDDGLPLTGNIIIGPIYSQCSDDVYDTSNGQCAFGGISTSGTFYHCALLSTGDYDTGYTPRSCSLRIKAQL